MIRQSSGKDTALWTLAAVAAVAAYLRLAHIGYGLPAVFNSDEPHHVNIAVSFGRGSLNPQVFKYPTLWMYTLFSAYGAYFIVWSDIGLLHSVREFGQFFIWHPGGFYLIARLLSVLFSMAALHRVYLTGFLIGDKRIGLWAAAFLATSPTLIVSAHAAKPDSMMFCFAAWAWWFAARYFKEGAAKDLIVCGITVGLAASTQYTAAPLVLLLPASEWARRLRAPARGWRALGWAVAALVGAFLAGSPFILFDWHSFVRDIYDEFILTGEGTPAGVRVLVNAVTFAGRWALGGAALCAGTVGLLRRDRAYAALLLVPAAANIALLIPAADGGWSRYLLGVFPAFALVAGRGVRDLTEHLPAFRWGHPALVAVLMFPGLWESGVFDRGISLPDTRTLAALWIEKNIPEGTRILADQEHASPPLKLSRDFVYKLLDQTRMVGQPRQKYYELMLESHPGGGYEVYQVIRKASALRVPKGILLWSTRGRAMLDVSSGLTAARAAGIEVVILTTFGADPKREPELARFIHETENEGKLLAAFLQEEGRSVGPNIRIYRIGERRRG